MKEFTINYCSNEGCLEVTSTGQILGSNTQINSVYNSLYTTHVQLVTQLNKLEKSMNISLTKGIPKKNVSKMNLTQVCILFNKLYGSNCHMHNKLSSIKSILNQTTKINKLTNCYI